MARVRSTCSYIYIYIILGWYKSEREYIYNLMRRDTRVWYLSEELTAIYVFCQQWVKSFFIWGSCKKEQAFHQMVPLRLRTAAEGLRDTQIDAHWLICDSPLCASSLACALVLCLEPLNLKHPFPLSYLCAWHPVQCDHGKVPFLPLISPS